MIVELHLKDWKSYSDSSLYIDPLTFLIGTNASGKSNVLDAFAFLRRVADGMQLKDALAQVRGGEAWAIRRGCKYFTISVTIEEDEYRFIYSLSVEKESNTFVVKGEELSKQWKSNEKRVLFLTNESEGSVTIDCRFFTGNKGQRKRLDLSKSIAVLTQVEGNNVQKEVKESCRIVINALKQIFILNPIPDNMRSYVQLSELLKPDGSNIAGVLAGMSDEKEQALENKLIQYVSKLPERDLVRVGTEKVGIFNQDAILYSEERWTDGGEVLKQDARGMSDGTLRFICIVTALLTLNPKSLLIIEEVDNGLHPSRSQYLISMLQTLGKERGIDVLCTTHNPVLIDALGHKMLPYISYVKRDRFGNSSIELLEDLPNLIKLMAASSIGGLMVNNEL